jgi:hypothetical protein
MLSSPRIKHWTVWLFGRLLPIKGETYHNERAMLFEPETRIFVIG